MDDRVSSGSQCQSGKCKHKHHADLWNIPTVQLGDTLSSLYISEQKIPPRQGESSGNNPNNIPPPNDRRGSVTPTVGTATSNGESHISPRKSRRREASSNSMETMKDDSSNASFTPSTPPTISSGKSYSGEMNDELTPLREALPPSISTRRRSVPTMEDNGGRRQNVNASSSYAEIIPDRNQERDLERNRNPKPSRVDLPSSNYNQFAGLSEILASPSYREVNASRSPEYTSSPFERAMINNNKGREGEGQVDYFTLPILRERERDRERQEGRSPRESHQDHDQEHEQGHSSITSSNETRKYDPERGGGSNERSSISTPSWSSSDVTSTRSSSLRSPRIRNEGMLAPHGSFTSDSGRQYQARLKLERAETQRRDLEEKDRDNESIRSGESVTSWRSKTASERQYDGSGRRQYSEEEYLENVQAARGGDQLALYHLGWGQVTANSRHTLGDASLVWGGVEQPSSPAASSRSSATSRPSLRSNSTSGSFPRHLSGKSHEETLREALSRDGKPNEKPKGQGHSRSNSNSGPVQDLFADVAHMTLKSNASNNRTQHQTSTPAPPTPSMERPSMFKSASYVSSVSAGTKETSEQRKERKARVQRAVDEGIAKDQKDPEKEKEREKRRAERRAKRREEGTSTSGSNATARHGQGGRPNLTRIDSQQTPRQAGRKSDDQEE